MKILLAIFISIPLFAQTPAGPITAGSWGKAARDQINRNAVMKDGSGNVAVTGTLSVGATVYASPVCDGAADDTATIQVALDTRAAHVKVNKAGACLISATLIVYSNQWLELSPQTTIRFKDGTADLKMLRNAGFAAQRSVTDAAISSSSNPTHLSSATAAFTSADVGRTVVVAGAYDDGQNLVANIVSITSGTVVVLDRPAYTTVSAAAASIFARDTRIRVSGGTWDRGTVEGASHYLQFRYVDDLKIHDLNILSIGGKFAIAPAAVTNASVERIHCVVFSACVQFNGPVDGATVRDITGSGQDDAIAFVAVDWPLYNYVVGAIRDVLIENVRYTATTNIVRLLGGTAHATVRNVTVKNLISLGGTAFHISSDAQSGGITDIDNVVLDGGVGDGLTNIAILDATNGGAITLMNLRNAISADNQTMFTDSPTANWTAINVQNSTVSFATSVSSGAGISILGTVSHLSVADTKLIAGNTNTLSLVLFAFGSTVGGYDFRNLSQIKGNTLVAYQSANVGPGKMSGILLSECKRLAEVYYTTLDLTITNITLNNAFPAIYVATDGSVAALRGSGVQNVSGLNGFDRSASQVIHCKNADWPADLSMLTPAIGDKCYNSNAALGTLGAVGPVVSDATTWHLMSNPTLVYP